MSVALAFLAFVSSAPAQRARLNGPAMNPQAAGSSPVGGVYNGTYDAGQGPVKFKLALTQQDYGALAGTFTVSLPDGAGTTDYICNVNGRYIPANGMFQITRGRWEAAPPQDFDIFGMSGTFDAQGADGAGKISGKMRARPPIDFDAIRDAGESKNLAEANAAKKVAAAPAAPQDNPRRAPQVINILPPAGAASVDTSSPTAINGVYKGGYQVAGGNVLTARFCFKASDDGSLTGLFTFDLPASAGSGSATYKLTGKYVAGNRWPFQFTTVEPVGKPGPEAYAMTSVSAGFVQGGLVQGKNGIEYSLNPDRIAGSVRGGPGIIGLSAERDKAAGDLDKAWDAQANAAISGAPAAPVARPAYEGVYNGSYEAKQGTIKFKLTIWMKKESRTLDGKLANSDLAGVLALNVPEGSETKTYTCELSGMINPQRNLQLTVKRWEGSPPMEILHIGGVSGKFDPDGGGPGVAHISGYVSAANSSKFEVNRDAAESAKLDMTSVASNVRAGIPGVFNGTYTRENEQPSKIKLSITRTSDELDGVATIDLPSGSGTKPYTYSLRGSFDGSGGGAFHLMADDWESPPPAQFKNFRGMGFNGKLVVDLGANTARIVSAPAPSSLATFYVPEFEATWDAKESAHINQTVAAQKAIGAEGQAAAMKAREEMIKNAKPKELASNDLVRKSRAYWDNYQTDMVREVFDGGFGDGIDENKVFQQVFCTYVEMFSAKFPECLPANHQKVTIIWRTNRKFDQFGNLVSEENHDYTLDMDSRFVDGYKRCHEALTSKAAGLQEAIAAAQPGGVQHVIGGMMGVATDMQRFFADHGGKSAATNQMIENFVRAINDQPSLQQAGEKISGAQAESDKDLLPGHYARFVDGANAYFRARAKSDPVRYGGRSTHDTAVCQRLAELYQFSMSPDEQYYYANDFAGRFLPIMGPRQGCTDPAWPRLHPAVEKAIAEVK